MAENRESIFKYGGLMGGAITIILFVIPILMSFNGELFALFYFSGLSLMIISIILLLGSQKEKENAIRKEKEREEREKEILMQKEKEILIKGKYQEIIDRGLEDLLFNFIRKYGTRPSEKSDEFYKLLKNRHKVDLSGKEIIDVLRYAEEDMKDKMEDIKLEEMERELTQESNESDTGKFKPFQQMEEPKTADWVILLVILSSLLCFIAGIWMLSIKGGGDTPTIFEAAFHATGLYFIAKGFFLGPALYLMGKKR